MTEQLGENLAGGADMIWEQAFQLATLQQQTAFLKQQNPAVGAIDERVVASYFSGVIIRIQGSPNEAVSVATRVPLSHAGLNEGSYLYVIRRLSVKGGCCECERMGGSRLPCSVLWPPNQGPGSAYCSQGCAVLVFLCIACAQVPYMERRMAWPGGTSSSRPQTTIVTRRTSQAWCVRSATHSLQA